jgi:hypothetical protein
MHKVITSKGGSLLAKYNQIIHILTLKLKTPKKNNVKWGL